MCGICGFVGLRDEGLLRRMTDALIHRGPDECGYYVKDDIALGHRRLSIIDLNTGKQPLFNEDKSISLVCNGEIYNYQEMRAELKEKGHRFITNTDVEVIIHLYEETGIDCVEKLNGMFAFAIWDDKKKRLFLVRDRLGIKPLYYTISNNNIFFASEIKAILQDKSIARRINLKALDYYLSLRYVPGNETLLQGIYKLPAATILIYENKNVQFHTYWHLPLSLEEQNVDEKECIEGFKSLLNDAVKTHLMSDVSFGAFISGGIDSGTIVGLMNKFISGRIKTFTIGFNSNIDEFTTARKISRYFDTAHHEITVDKRAYELFSKIIWYLDEPIGDAIIIPIYLLSRETARSVKMVLTGEGADEIFGSYIHQIALHFGQMYNQWLPLITKKIFNKLIASLPIRMLDVFFSYPAFLGKEGKQKLIQFLFYLNNNSKVEAYFSLASVFNEEEKNNLYTSGVKQILDPEKHAVMDEFNNLLSNTKNRLLNNVIGLDIKYWLADYTLCKLDRLTMANSLEGRVPFLDYRLVEFLARIPIKLKLRGITTKYLLRKSMDDLLPKETVNAPKKPFYFPTEKCFDRNFDVYLKDLLNKETIQKRGLFNYSYIKELIRDTRGSGLVRNKQIMSLAILENWMKVFIA